MKCNHQRCHRRVTFTEEILNGKLHFLCSAYSEPYQTSKMGRFEKTVKGLNPFISFAKRSILDDRQVSEYPCNNYST